MRWKGGVRLCRAKERHCLDRRGGDESSRHSPGLGIVPKGVGADGLRQTGTANGDLDGFVDDAGVNVMATGDTRTRVDGDVAGGKDVLPAPLMGGMGAPLSTEQRRTLSRKS